MAIKAITISPPAISLNLAAGEVQTGEIIVLNPSDSTEDMDYLARVTPYSVQNDDYSANFSAETAYTDIANWLTLENASGTLAPGETAKVKYTITVPESAPAGGQYCTISVQSLAGSGETVNESFEIASIIFAKVSGEIDETGEILELSSPGVVFVTPVKTTLSLKNSGNVHLVAQIETKVTSIFTGESIFATESLQTETVMPGTSRSATYIFDEFPELGLFQYSQTVTYAGEVKTDSHLIFVCPIWFSILSVVAFSSIVALIVSRIRRTRRKKCFSD